MRRLSELKNNSVQQLSAVRRAQSSMQIRQDVAFRSEWVDRRAAVPEEAAWVIAAAAARALQTPAGDGAPPTLPAVDEDGHLWDRFPAEDSVGFISHANEGDPRARSDYDRTLSLAPLMRSVRDRRTTIRNVSIWTASGVMRMSPWLDIHEALRQSNGELDRFAFNKNAKFPISRPPGGDAAVW